MKEAFADQALLLAVLAAVALSLFTVFSYVAASTLSPAMGLTLFLIVSGLLLMGYAVGFTVLVIIAIPLLGRFVRGKPKSEE